MLVIRPMRTMPRHCNALLLAVLATAVEACTVQSGETDTDCPSHSVTLDAAATGFSKVGEWRHDDVCLQYCTDPHEACTLVTATTVKCQVPCG